MLIVNVHEAKTKFSHYLGLVQKGKRVVVAKRNVPIAELKLLNKPKAKRALGQSGSSFQVPESFFKSLPKVILDSFENPK